MGRWVPAIRQSNIHSKEFAISPDPAGLLLKTEILPYRKQEFGLGSREA
jgi:hypothetical protein